MSVYGELDPMPENRKQFAFKDKREHIVYTKYVETLIDVKIPYVSRDHFIMLDTGKIMFNLDIESINKTRSILNIVWRALVKKRC